MSEEKREKIDRTEAPEESDVPRLPFAIESESIAYVYRRYRKRSEGNSAVQQLLLSMTAEMLDVSVSDLQKIVAHMDRVEGPVQGIHLFHPAEVLVRDGRTESQAEKDLEKGSVVWDPEDFFRELREDPALQKELEIQNLDDILKLCRESCFKSDVSFGSIGDVPYVITYAL